MLCSLNLYKQETCQLLVFLVQNACNIFASTVIFIFTRACTIVRVARASGIPSPSMLWKDDKTKTVISRTLPLEAVMCRMVLLFILQETEKSHAEASEDCMIHSYAEDDCVVFGRI